MEQSEMNKLLNKLKDEDETKRLELLKKILDFYKKCDYEKYEEIIYEEYNNLAKEISHSLIKEKGE